MSPRLIDKLRSLGAEQENIATAPSESAHEPEGAFHYVQERFPLSCFCDRRFASAENLSAIFGETFPARLKEEDFLFLDTETTGLSGGVGTVAFQVGLGYLENGSFVSEQFFMRDYHEESAMLREISYRMARFPVIITFNGKAFDIPLLKSRFLMNRLDSACIPALHGDVLFPARRLWKLRLGSCRLSRLEEVLLGVLREDDLPGALVPQTYFQYLKDRNFKPIKNILRHNQQDIVSLAQLFFYLSLQYAKPENISHEEDLLSMARAHQHMGQTLQAVKCYRLSARSNATRAQAFQALAAHEKRQNHTDNAIRLYEAMTKRGEDPSLAYEALAKLAEHQKKDVKQALHYTRQALLCIAEPSLFKSEAVQSRQSALQYRYARLLRKQAKQ